MSQKIINSYNNKKLKEALKDCNDIIDNLDLSQLDDKELEIIDKYKKLSQFEKDLIYLRSQMSVIEIAELYQISRLYIYKRLKLIYEKIK